ncbi:MULTISPECIES: YdbH domain-containing protein [Marinobacter]|uniref:YdbH domain-containing protein n=1 Tax=Marinobacter TaxID=2742 RepID=UPI001248DCF2|nr:MULTISPECIES: YdbH domain-containing protein [Marinobacter]MBL3558897.1 YdbH domain-containing protein [Marinobacter sp. JB05H06]
MARSVTLFRTLRRLLLWGLVLFVLLVIAGGWYARVAWEDWRQANNLHSLEWQGIEVSLGGVRLQDFSASQVRDGQPYSLEGGDLSLGWSWDWHGPVLNVLRVGLLRVDIPVWPGSEQQAGASDGIPADLPLWLPEEIMIDRLVLTLPDDIRAEGDLAVSKLSRPDQRELVTKAMSVEGATPAMTLAGWQLHKGQAKLVFAGKADGQSATLEFNDETRLELARVNAPANAAQLDNVRLNLAGTKLNTKHSLQPMVLETLAFEGPVVATASAFHHPHLNTQPWRLDGWLGGNLKALRLDGRLSSDAGASADIAFRFPFDGIPDLDAEMTATGARGHRALADTFTALPEELEIGEGSIHMSLGLRFPSDGIQIQGEIGFEDLGGLFGRTAWAGLAGKVAIEISDDRLEAHSSGLSVASVNPGIPFSNIQLAVRYRSTTEQLAAGTLVLEQGTAGLLGGNLRIEPGEWQLTETPLKILLELSDIELSQLMEVYPSEGLAGSGILRGTVPVLIGEQGVIIEAGKVEAEPPGGTLKLPAERLKGMAQNNEAMALVVQAMENFHYTVLNSTVDYDEDGKLFLGLRLEGSSPEVRDGHPIVLNINLEEDIPALLTSLQLSGRVNEAVTEKVRNLMQKRDEQSQPGGSEN